MTLKRDRVEPLDPKPLVPRVCDYCGGPCDRGRSYCSPACRVAYNNLCARQAKPLMQLLKRWRKHRGGKGTPGEGQMALICARIDAILAEDRARHRDLQKR